MTDLRLPDAGLRGDDRAQRWGAFLKAVPGMMAELARVPDTHWTREVAGEHGETPVANVRCVCGAEMLVEEGESHQCQCPRTFLYLGRDKLYVANSPKRVKPRWEQIAEDWRSQLS